MAFPTKPNPSSSSTPLPNLRNPPILAPNPIPTLLARRKPYFTQFRRRGARFVAVSRVFGGMASDSWGCIAASSKRHQANLQSQFADLYLGFEEMDLGDEESRVEYGCPFCAEDFDVVGLCCHVEDDHPLELKNGICPVCASRVGLDLVGHITTQHGHLFKIQRRRNYRRSSSGSHSALSLLKKELREGHLQSLLGGSAYATPSLNTTPDPLLSSFIYHLPSLSDAGNDVEPVPLDEETLTTKSIDVDVRESFQPSLSDKDHKERAQKSEFVQGLVLSTIFHDTL